MKYSLILPLLSILLTSATIQAQDLDITDQYVRETIPGTKISSAYMTIKNSSEQDRKLVAITSPISERIELHQHSMEDGMMQMQQVESIIIKANNKVVLQPHGFHVMIFDLDKPLQASSTVSMTLKFANGSIQKISIPVQGLKKMSHHH